MRSWYAAHLNAGDSDSARLTRRRPLAITRRAMVAPFDRRRVATNRILLAATIRND